MTKALDGHVQKH